ncbi:MAG: GHKL domain-containing protein [Eubacterium sp.]|nr:GHKL domain-containing protein [Eubacterium sp.]
MDDYDLVVVLGNILDNAVEAVESVTEPGKRIVGLSITMTDTDFLIGLKP